MKIIFLPLFFSPIFLIYFGAALIIGIIALIKTINLWRFKKIQARDLLFGFIISITIFYVLYLTKKEKTGGLLIFPIFMLFIPYALHIIAEIIKRENYISKISLISIAFSIVVIICEAIFQF